MPHTKGPWGFDPERCSIVSLSKKTDFGDPEFDSPVSVCCTMAAMGGDDSDADLALMVASPVMLEALLDCQRLMDGIAQGQRPDKATLQAMREQVQDTIAEARSLKRTVTPTGDIITPTGEAKRERPVPREVTIPQAEVKHGICCPRCGDEEHLYCRGDMRYDPATVEWEVDEIQDDEVECTSCDWRGDASELGEKK